jgi:NAD(P)-dependent dehydrogenase (short-subunit alcohol dehydrogenase family)
MAAISLDGARVLVIGGSSGFGEATAAQAAAQGAQVIIASRSADKLDAAAARIGRRCRTAVLDVRDGEAIATLLRDLGTLEHVVLTAGELPPPGPMTLEHMREQADARFWSAIHVSRNATFGVNGSLTLVTGAATLRPPKGMAPLSAIGAAVNALSRGLAQDLAPVRVNTVIPGAADTPLWNMLPADKKAERMEQIGRGLPVGRVGQADDVALQIIACMVNPFMTGSLVVLDGGGSI